MGDRYAVIGNPIGHTKSPLIHGFFAQETGQDMSYEAIEGPVEPASGFSDSVRSFIAAGGRGMNVTAPFKLEAFAMSDERSERAELSGAVNAMKFENGRIIAENFDGVGLVRDIEVNLHQPMAGKRVLILGAGGAARGALLPFVAARPAELVVTRRGHLLNRSQDRSLLPDRSLHAGMRIWRLWGASTWLSTRHRRA
jgi:shikimate dehydrogenase